MKSKISLYLVATPIGNLSDFSERAINTLKEVDFIASEDTRHSMKLLNKFKIKKPLVSYFEHNKRERGEEILKRLQNGETCALITDAGMPAISDPGEDLVRLCYENDITVSVIPGASAAISAIAVSGLFTGRFCFEGFLSTTTKNRREHLESLKNESRTMIFYEAPHKLKKTLADLLGAFGDRRVTIVRELTKLHEEIARGTISDMIKKYETISPKGEFVLVLEGKREETREKADEISAKKIFDVVEMFIKKGLSKSDAIKNAAIELNCRKNEIYRIYSGKDK